MERVDSNNRSRNIDSLYRITVQIKVARHGGIILLVESMTIVPAMIAEKAILQ